MKHYHDNWDNEYTVEPPKRYKGDPAIDRVFGQRGYQTMINDNENKKHEVIHHREIEKLPHYKIAKNTTKGVLKSVMFPFRFAKNLILSAAMFMLLSIIPILVGVKDAFREEVDLTFGLSWKSKKNIKELTEIIILMVISGVLIMGTLGLIVGVREGNINGGKLLIVLVVGLIITVYSIAILDGES